MAIINGTVSKNNYEFYAELSETIPSDYISTNRTVVNYAIYLKNNGTRTDSSYWTFSASYDGNSVYSASNQKVKTNDVSSSGGVKLLFSGSFDVYHNAGGDKTINFSASITKSSPTTYDPGNCSLSGNFTLTTIPRYANFTYNYLENVAGYDGLHGIRVLWGTDVSCDWVQYSLNGGGWIDTSGQNFVIWGLSPATTYSIKVRVRRTDSQLWTESGTMWGTTRDINRITSGTPNVSNGSALRVTASSNSGANCRIRLECGGASRLSKNGTDVTFSVAEIESLMQFFPNNASFGIRVVADTLDNNGNATYWNWTDGTYTIVNSNPIFSTFNYEDVNQDTLVLTGDDQTCIIGYSSIKATVPVGSKATAQNSATMNKYTFVVDNQQIDGAYSSEEDVEMTLNNVNQGILTMYATDSRGFSTRVDKFADTIINYFNVQKNAEISCIRVDSQGQHTGVSELVKLSFGGTIWMGDFGQVNNEIVNVSYRYINSKMSDWATGITTITPTLNQDGTFTFEGLIRGDSSLGFEIANAYNLEIYVTDKLSTAKYEVSLSSGKPHIAYAESGIGFMGAYDENVGGLVQIDGRELLDSSKYSTQEIIVGRWTNGKYIYRKVIDNLYGTMAVEAWTTIATITNIDTLIRGVMGLDSSSKVIWNEVSMKVESNNNVQYYSPKYAHTYTFAILEYTKND